MANVISFTGKIRKLKENGYTEQEFTGGLIKKRLRFQAICGNSVQWLEVSALVWKDEKKNKILTYKAVENGKDERMEVKWTDRFNEDIINQVAGYRRYLIDTDTFSRRKSLEEEGLDDELEKSQKKRKEFLHASDFIDYLKKVLDSDKSKDMIFHISGTVDFNYGENKDMFYRSFTPQKIYRVEDDAEQKCNGSMKLYFAENAVDDTMEDETGDIVFNTYAQYYDNNVKANAFVPFQVKIAKDHPKAKGFKKIFGKAEGDEVKELGCVVDFINGAKQVEITEDMLTDDQKEMVELGMTSLDEIKAELGGGTVYGDRVTETRLLGLAKGYSGGCVDTAFQSDDLVQRPHKEEPKADEEVEVDLFEGMDDDEI